MQPKSSQTTEARLPHRASSHRPTSACGMAPDRLPQQWPIRLEWSGHACVHPQDLEADLYLINDDFSYERNSNETWSFQSSKLNWENLPMPSLYGGTQVSNAATALMVLLTIDDKLPVTRESVEQGLSTINLLGRFQRIAGPCEIILDVAHNLDSAKVLVKNLQDLEPVSKTYAVFAALADKDIDGIIDAVKGNIV